MNRWRVGYLLLGLISFVAVNAATAGVVQAATQTVSVYPNSDVNNGNWTSLSSGSSYWARVNKLTANRDDSSWICSAVNTTTGYYDAGASTSTTAAPMPDIQQGVTSISAEITGRSSYNLFDFTTPNVSVGVLINGSSIGSGTNGWGTSQLSGSSGCSGSYNELRTTTMSAVNATAGSEWTQSQMDTMQFSLTRSSTSSRGVRVYTMYANLSYVTYSTLAQEGYRFYQNANSASPGTALGASASTALDYDKDSNPSTIRLRMAVKTSSERWLRQYGSYKLQYVLKGAGTCASPSGSWADVQSGSGAIRWYDNASPANGAAISNVTGQPSGTMVAQRYQEANPFSKQAEVASGSYGIWDFSLSVASANYGAYCFRVVNSDGDTQSLSSYTNYPELRLVGNLSVDIFDSDTWAPISSPVLNFSLMTTSAVCRQSVTTIASPTYIRVIDNRASGNWTVGIAATNGATAKWQSGANQYSFNDSSGAPAGCAHGLLSLDLSSIGALAQGDLDPANYAYCTASGLSPGSGGAFSGATPQVIGSASSAAHFCTWYIYGVSLKQMIPAAQPVGSYSIDITVTVTAS